MNINFENELKQLVKLAGLSNPFNVMIVTDESTWRLFFCPLLTKMAGEKDLRIEFSSRLDVITVESVWFRRAMPSEIKNLPQDETYCRIYADRSALEGAIALPGIEKHFRADLKKVIFFSEFADKELLDNPIYKELLSDPVVDRALSVEFRDLIKSAIFGSQFNILIITDRDSWAGKVRPMLAELFLENRVEGSEGFVAAYELQVNKCCFRFGMPADLQPALRRADYLRTYITMETVLSDVDFDSIQEKPSSINLFKLNQQGETMQDRMFQQV